MNVSIAYPRPDRLALIRLLAFGGLGLLLFGRTVLDLYAFSRGAGEMSYSHFVLIPVVAIYLVFSERKRIFAEIRPMPASFMAALMLPVLGILCAARINWWESSDALAFKALCLVAYFVVLFAITVGPIATRRARFALLFLFFMIPIPQFLLHNFVKALQCASVEVVDALFDVVRSNHFRSDFYFSLPGLEIEVAPACSGIRSAISLTILSVLIGRFALCTSWGRLLLVAAVFPISVFKNGVRIVALSELAVHWDRRIMVGSLHTSGGIPFFAVAVTLLLFVMLLIRRIETRIKGQPIPGGSALPQPASFKTLLRLRRAWNDEDRP